MVQRRVGRRHRRSRRRRSVLALWCARQSPWSLLRDPARIMSNDLGMALGVQHLEIAAGHSAPASAIPTPPLFHFTCDHCAPSIVGCGALLPNRQPFFPYLAPLVWLTSLPDPERDAVGLTSSTYIACDRMAHRFRVLDTSTCLPWLSAIAIAPSYVVPADPLELLHSY